MQSVIISSSAGGSSCRGKQRISTDSGSHFCCLACKASQRFMASISDIKQSKPLCISVGFTSSNLNAEHPYFVLAQVEVEDSCEDLCHHGLISLEVSAASHRTEHRTFFRISFTTNWDLLLSDTSPISIVERPWTWRAYNTERTTQPSNVSR